MSETVRARVRLCVCGTLVRVCVVCATTPESLLKDFTRLEKFWAYNLNPYRSASRVDKGFQQRARRTVARRASAVAASASRRGRGVGRRGPPYKNNIQ